MLSCQKLIKNHTKTLAFITLGKPQRKEIDDYENVYSVNPLYLFIDQASGYIEEKDLNLLYLHIDHAGGYVEKEGANKYLVFDSTDQIKGC